MVHLHSRQCAYKPGLGFTLGELLISLAILGVIATFTIPKVLSTQRDQSYNAKAKEFAATIAGAYQKMQMQGLVNDYTGPYSFLAHANYTAFDTTASIDTDQNTGTQPCAPCIALHDGSRVAFGNAFSFAFGGTNPTNAIFFVYDPDGKITDGTTNGPGKSVRFILFRDGRVTSAGRYKGTFCTASFCYNTVASNDPPWFEW